MVTLFPYTTLFRSVALNHVVTEYEVQRGPDEGHCRRWRVTAAGGRCDDEGSRRYEHHRADDDDETVPSSILALLISQRSSRGIGP